MGYRVRSPEGELHFKHFVDIANAFRQGLVGPDDIILEDGKEKGVTARQHPLLGEPPPTASAVTAQRAQIVLACALGLAALLVWTHQAWSLLVRTSATLAIAIALALLLTHLVQKTARPKR